MIPPPLPQALSFRPRTQFRLPGFGVGERLSGRPLFLGASGHPGGYGEGLEAFRDRLKLVQRRRGDGALSGRQSGGFPSPIGPAAVVLPRSLRRHSFGLLPRSRRS